MGDARRRKNLGLLVNPGKPKWYRLEEIGYGQLPGTWMFSVAERGLLYSPEIKIIGIPLKKDRLLCLTRDETFDLARQLTGSTGTQFVYIMDKREVKINKYNTQFAIYGSN